jgi:tRNA nucleotidyltransferase (CCA-adding enzyme)
VPDASGSTLDALPQPCVPDAVLVIVRRLTAAGHEAWCVGGAIRDAILGIPSTDFDITTSASPDLVVALFRRTVAIGIQYGTVGVIGDDDVMREVTTFRADVATDGRHAVVQYGVSLDDDLARRDFTINAIAWQPDAQEWRDPFGGLRDLRAGVLRAVGDPALRFREDYLRILRAVRFSARFRFAMDPATYAAAVALSSGLRGLSAERVLDEWKKGLAATPDLALLVALWHEIGAAAEWMPELRAHDEVRTLALPTITEGRDLACCTAALTTSPTAVLQRLKAPSAAIARTAAMERGPVAPAGDDARVVRRWLTDVQEAADDLRAVASMRRGSDPTWGAVIDDIRARGDATSRGTLAIKGGDLIKAGIRPGPLLGGVLDQLLDEVVEEPSRNEAVQLLARALEIAAARAPQ